MPRLFKRKRRHTELAVPRELQAVNRLVSLNVSDTESLDFNVRKRLIFDFELVSFTPARNNSFDKVFLKETVFWQKGHGSDQCVCVRSYAKKGAILFVELNILKEDSSTFEYYYRDFYKWVATDPAKFTKSFTKLVDLFYVRATPKLNINGKPNPRLFYVNRSFDAPFYVITPKPGIWVDRVVDGIVDIWEKNYKSEICTNAVILHANNKPRYCYLLVNELDALNQEVFFKKDGITWVRIAKDEFVNAVSETGFDTHSFINKLVLDISNVGKNFTVEKLEVDTVSTAIITPLNGYKVHKVLDGDYIIWNDELNHVTNASTSTYTHRYTYEHRQTLLNLYVREGHRTVLLYFAKRGGVWARVEKPEYEALFALTEDPINTHRSVGVDKQGNRKLFMSHFRNKDDLIINTFHAPVENSRGNMILVHGAFGHFCSDYATYSHDFCLEFEHYSPTVQMRDFSNAFYECMDSYSFVNKTLLERKDCFEHRALDGLDMFDTGPRFQYRRSFVEALNNMGYCVYGLDLPSHGHSEALTPTRFFTRSFDDYVEDVLQFVSIVRRGKFYDTAQSYEDLSWTGGLDFPVSAERGDSSTESFDRIGSSEFFSRGGANNYVDGKYYLLGYSMGSNVCLRAVNEYYKRTRSSKKLIDGLVCLSGMYELAAVPNPVMQRLAAFFISILSFFAPKCPNPLEKPFDFTMTYDSLSRFRDPMYASKKSCNKTLLMIAKATFNLAKNLSFLPEDLPTLMLNSVNDDMVNIEGARRVSKLIKNSRLVELKGNVHGLPLPPYVTVVTPILKEWLCGVL